MNAICSPEKSRLGLNCALTSDEFCNEGELQVFTASVNGLCDTLGHTILEPNSLGPGPIIDLNLGNGRFEPKVTAFGNAAIVRSDTALKCLVYALLI